MMKMKNQSRNQSDWQINKYYMVNKSPDTCGIYTQKDIHIYIYIYMGFFTFESIGGGIQGASSSAMISY